MSAPVEPNLGNVVTAALWGWLIFTGLVGWIMFSAVLVLSSSYTSAPTPITVDTGLQAIAGAVVFGGLALFFAGVVGLIVTLVIGAPLGWVAGRLLRTVNDWRLHVAAYFTVGAVSAAVVVVGFFVLDQNPYAAALPFAIALGPALAGVSAAAGWVILWRFPARRGQYRAAGYAVSPASL